MTTFRGDSGVFLHPLNPEKFSNVKIRVDKGQITIGPRPPKGGGLKAGSSLIDNDCRGVADILEYGPRQGIMPVSTAWGIRDTVGGGKYVPWIYRESILKYD